MSIRIYESGYSKLQKNKRVKLFVESRKETMNKSIKINKLIN